MGPLYNTNCYLSSPIEFDNLGATNWRQDVCDCLKEKFGINVFDPSKDIKQDSVVKMDIALENEDYDTVENICKMFTKKDLAVIDRSDFLIAASIKGIPTTGVPCEIIHAINLKKPVMIVATKGKKTASKWYFGNLKHQYIFGNWDDLYKYLQEVNEYKHVNNHRWWYTYKMV